MFSSHSSHSKKSGGFRETFISSTSLQLYYWGCGLAAVASGLEAIDPSFISLAKFLKTPDTSSLKLLCPEDSSRLKNDTKTLLDIKNFSKHLAQW